MEDIRFLLEKLDEGPLLAGDTQLGYAEQVAARLKGAGLRAEVDARGERMNAKIRDAQKAKIPYMLVVGDKEVEQGMVAPRLRSEEKLAPMPVEAFLARARADIEAGV